MKTCNVLQYATRSTQPSAPPAQVKMVLLVAELGVSKLFQVKEGTSS